MIPKTLLATAVDEADLVSQLNTLAASAGWTVVNAGVTPANTTWFKSLGEDGDHIIVGGMLPDTVARRLSVYTAADLDQNAIVAANVSGYINNDGQASFTGLAAKQNAPTLTSQWVQRAVAATIRVSAVANLNGISALVKYQSNAGPIAQGFIYIGTTRTQAGNQIQEYAYGRIAVIDVSALPNVTLTLDRNINAALKDHSAPYNADPATYIQSPMFQSVSAPAMPVGDFALTERIKIVNGSLTTAGGNTKFTILCNKTAGTGKLSLSAAAAGRYANGRGVGDIVRLASSPNIAAAFASSSGGAPITTSQAVLAAWDAVGGQKPIINVSLVNRLSTAEVSISPGKEHNRFAQYPLYAVIVDSSASIIPQTDNNGKKNVGALYNLFQCSAGAIPDLAILMLDGKSYQRYRLQGLAGVGIGLGNASSTFGATVAAPWMVGPGW